MKLRHILYENVSVKGKAQFHQFIGGELEIEDAEEIKELLKNKNIEEIKEEEPAGDAEGIQEAEKGDRKKGKQK